MWVLFVDNALCVFLLHEVADYSQLPPKILLFLIKYSWMSAPAICTLVCPSSPAPSFLDVPSPPSSHRYSAHPPRDICTQFCSCCCCCCCCYDGVGPVYFMLLSVFVGGKMLDEERMEFESMQARLIESEDRVHHYEMLVRNRDQELTKTKRVSTQTYWRQQDVIYCLC
jgi:hypothetical protein